MGAVGGRGTVSSGKQGKKNVVRGVNVSMRHARDSGKRGRSCCSRSHFYNRRWWLKPHRSTADERGETIGVIIMSWVFLAS